jgi:hypothetical protein
MTLWQTNDVRKVGWIENCPCDRWIFISSIVELFCFVGNCFKEYGKVVHDYCVEIKHERHYLGAIMAEFERQHNPKMQVKFGREEMAFSLWVVDNSLKSQIFWRKRGTNKNFRRGHVMRRYFTRKQEVGQNTGRDILVSGNYKHPTRWFGRPP